MARGLMWVGAAAILEILMLLVDRFYINYTIAAESVAIATAFYTVLQGLRMVGLVAALVGVVLGIVCKKKGKPTCLPLLLAIGGTAVMTCSHMSIR